MTPTDLLVPPPLQRGDKVALVAPARWASDEVIAAGVAQCEAWGFEAVVHPSTRNRYGQFGGTDDQRSEALNQALRDPEVRAVWALRGGYGCTRLLPRLDVEALRNDPTWVVGFSDVTALHGWATGAGVASLHGPVVSTLSSTNAGDIAALHKALTTPHAVRRRVVGGNLSVLYAMLGTPYFPPVAGRWLLLEDLDEYLYHVDRMLVALGQAGVFDAAEGVLVGSFTEMRDNTRAFGQATDNPFGRTVREMVDEHVVARGCRVEWDVPSGHGQRNAPVVLG